MNKPQQVWVLDANPRTYAMPDEVCRPANGFYRMDESRALRLEKAGKVKVLRPPDPLQAQPLK
jgi:hypothetical protein